MQKHQLRVVTEKKELDIKAGALSDFIGNNTLFLNLDKQDQELMKEQNETMWEYSEILAKRIARF